MIRLHKHLGRRFTSSIRICRCKDARLQQLAIVFLDLAIDLVGGHMDEPLDADLLRTFQQHVGAIYIGMREAVRVAKTEIDMRLSRKVKNGVDFMALHAVQDLSRMCQVSVVKRKVGAVIQGARVIERRAIVQLVKRYYIIGFGVSQCEMTHHPRGAAMRG